MKSRQLPIRKFECSDCKHSDYRMSTRKAGEVVPAECPKCHGSMTVSTDEIPKWLEEKLELISKNFEILDFAAGANKIDLEVSSKDLKRSFRSLLVVLRKSGYLPIMRERNGDILLTVVKQPKVKPSRIEINLVLFIATVITTFLVGYYILFGSFLDAGLFSGSLMLMLGTHEFGHKISTWRNGVESTMPYFIPAPNVLGTFGAVINIKSPIPTKEALVEMGAAGPLMGFAIALPITLVGLYFSEINQLGSSLPFFSPIFAILQLIALGKVSGSIDLSPLAFAGWVVILLTMFNLLPAGQLDGGHIARGLLNRQRHFTLTRTMGFALIIIGLFFPGFPLSWWGFLIIIMFRGYHVGALDDVSKLSGRHKALAAVALFVFLLCLPFQFS